MFGLFQNTPQYAGNGQPTANNNLGIFGFLSGLFGCSGTPRYATAEEKPPTNPGPILGPAPSTEPTSEQATETACPETATPETVSDQLAAQPVGSVPLPFAIVIQRPQP